MGNAPLNPDWAWPALIQSLQRDVERLREAMDDARRETVAAREAHRQELDKLIEQLRKLSIEIAPVLEERASTKRLVQQTRWAWLERAGWLVIGGVALAVWEFLRRHLRE